MNLAIEYLVRSGVIRNFLKMPCSLLLSSIRDQEKVAVTVEEKDKEEYLVSHWTFDPSYDEMLPRVERHQICKSDVFDTNRVVIPEYLPIPYTEQPISTLYNSYSHPMPNQFYESYYHRYLNSSQNSRNREYWLWSAFLEMHFPNMAEDREVYIEDDYIENIVKQEKQMIQILHKKHWNVWRLWKSLLLPSNRVAPELIFFSSFFGSCEI